MAQPGKQKRVRQSVGEKREEEENSCRGKEGMIMISSVVSGTVGMTDIDEPGREENRRKERERMKPSLLNDFFL